MRTKQNSNSKGSLKWIQTFANEQQSIINRKIQTAMDKKIGKIEWKSPLAGDDYAEYRDGDFLRVLGLEDHEKELKAFWPTRGPQWDALAKTSDGRYLLIEAKANIPETLSRCGAKDEKSKARINKSIKQTREFLKVKDPHDWNNFYQYANRLAHLYFLREMLGMKAHMVFVYFCNDHTHIPTTCEQWQGALTLQKNLMGLNRHLLGKYVHEVFLDVSRRK